MNLVKLKRTPPEQKKQNIYKCINYFLQVRIVAIANVVSKNISIIKRWE